MARPARRFDSTKQEQSGIDAVDRALGRRMADPQTGDQGFQTQNVQSRQGGPSFQDRGAPATQSPRPVVLPSELDIQAANTAAATRADGMNPDGTFNNTHDGDPMSGPNAGQAVKAGPANPDLQNYVQGRRLVAGGPSNVPETLFGRQDTSNPGRAADYIGQSR